MIKNKISRSYESHEFENDAFMRSNETGGRRCFGTPGRADVCTVSGMDTLTLRKAGPLAPS